MEKKTYYVIGGVLAGEVVAALGWWSMTDNAEKLAAVTGKDRTMLLWLLGGAILGGYLGGELTKK